MWYTVGVSTELEPRKGPAARAQVVEEARDVLARLAPGAVATLADLMMNAEKESVRLQATVEILGLAGVTKTQHVNVAVDADAHRQAEEQALALARALEQNKRPPMLDHTPSLEALVVLEDESDALPTTAPVEGALEATSSESR